MRQNRAGPHSGAVRRPLNLRYPHGSSPISSEAEVTMGS